MSYSSKKTTGELQEVNEFILDWKIHNFSSLFNGDAPHYSPSFTFADLSWHLSTGALLNSDSVCIKIALVLESFGPPKSLTYSLSLKNTEGKIFWDQEHSDVFEPFMLNFHNLLDPSSFHVGLSAEWPSYIPMPRTVDEFLRMVSSHFPADIVTIEFRTDLFNSMNGSGSECISLSQEALAALSRNKMLQDLKKLFHTGEHCDVTLKVKEQEFQAHKVILCARSSVFASTFRHDMKGKATGVVDIKDCDPDSFRDVLCFLYCGDVQNLSMGNVFSLFIAADKYDVPELRSRCLEFMKNNLSEDNFFDILTLALQYSKKEFIDLIVDFFARNMYVIMVTPKWQSFLLNNTIAGNEILVKALACNKKR